MKDCLVLLNPSAGGGGTSKKSKRIKRLLHEAGISYDLHVTSSETDLRRMVRKSVDIHPYPYRQIVGIGGDTTFRIIAEEVRKSINDPESQPAIGMIGTGSANDIMKSIGMYPVQKAVESIRAAQTAMMDVGMIRVNGRSEETIFLGSVSFGLGTEVNRFIEKYKAEGRWVTRMGHAGQILSGLMATRAAFRNGKVPLTVEYSGVLEQKSVRSRFSLFVILNTPLYANGIRFLKNCSPFDGYLNFLGFQTRGMMDTLSHYLNHRKKQFLNGPFTSMTIRFEEPVQIQVDGDILDQVSQMAVSLSNRRLKTIVPSDMKSVS